MQVKLFARETDTVGSLQFQVDSIRAHAPFVRLRAQEQRSILVGEIFAINKDGISIIVDDVLGAGPKGPISNPQGRTPHDL